MVSKTHIGVLFLLTIVTLSYIPYVASVSSSFIIPSSGAISYVLTRPLHVEGRYIKDSGGNIVHLRGVVAGGWVDDYAGIWSPEGGGHLDGFNNWNPDWVKQHLDAMKSWGCNFIRTLTAIDYWKFNIGNHRQHIKDFIEWAGQRGIYVLFGFWCVTHYEEGTDWGQQTPFPYPPYIPESYESVIASKQEFIDVWADVANELKNYPNALFDLFNEVGGDFGDQEDVINEWWTVAQGCVDAIRAHCDNIIDLEYSWGVFWDFNWGPVEESMYYWATMEWINRSCTVDGTNLVYDTHIYRDSGSAGYWSGGGLATSYEDIKSAFQHEKLDWVGETLEKPLIIGEVGCNSYYDQNNELTAFANILQIFNEWGLHYSAWIWLQWGTVYNLLEYREVVTFNPSESGQILMDKIPEGTV